MNSAPPDPRVRYACKFCIAMFGLKGQDVYKLPASRAETVAHIAQVHGYPGRSALVILQNHFWDRDDQIVHATARIIEETGPCLAVTKI